MTKRVRSLLMVFLFSALFSKAAWALPYYQLRDVSGERDGHTVAGSQWFATVWDSRRPLPSVPWTTYQDTEGGEAPGVPMVTSADLLYNFRSVYMEDPQRNYTGGDDVSFDPIESVYLVIPEGRGSMKIDFGNDFAQHNPYGPQPAMEDVLVSVPDYTTRVEPGRPRLIPINAPLNATVSFQADAPQSYGSTLGYLTFRQSASFDTGFTGYRGSIKIPLVVANVFDGTAAEAGNELYFDMTVIDGGEVLTRNKFRWDADRDMTRDIGTFFTMRPAGAAMPVYDLETRVTNRTGTRYRLQRYDITRAAYGEIYPRDWAYDLTPDLYGSLPANFQLDPQSQIAPGLVTAYESRMDMTYGSAESFRLYPYQGAERAHDLRLTFRKVGGMTPYGTVSAPGATPPWSVTGFAMAFADVIRNGENTADEIAAYAGGRPVMSASGYVFGGVSDRYIRADAFDSFVISTDVPPGLVGSDDVGLLPVKIRMRISRREAPIVGIWNDLANADSVISTFANTCAVWVRSDATAERDMNLFTTLRNRGYSPEKCVQAFTYDDYLYLDFVVLLADAISQNSGRTAFCQVVEDDKVPYILIGDGAVDGVWNLSFYVAPAGDNPMPDPDPDPNPKPSGSGGGGGCNVGLSFLILALAVPGAFRRLK